MKWLTQYLYAIKLDQTILSMPVSQYLTNPSAVLNFILDATEAHRLSPIFEKSRDLYHSISEDKGKYLRTEGGEN
ncbi:MAG: hypothetical protein EAZ78_06570 [Oscillatoriales cyanobacterium]|uniref:hypothetical protein n=1 Tax=Microcoleus anatoxicus TaxID=2705319 RepID=UPI0029739A6F|nr:MAG: hypothetical protein EA000_11870 [Oscillatoriales cyanobacterium]TAD98053.1 MAG: hypothetical protein EAZ98_07915 [Oscillatoriales cyanobacterium]TAE06326.1 MAG: hypothetical protein EAZ96_02705 [Oscillatoriales cyanobacterium]TAF05151.1 MAG: hypothetical protein EAZ78_06570 [Oscillatoriales cyanobacterium]TAF47096.1 MAG: hypothetical protein EAZ68_02645 [Oscillatoriales cyanobacterium]